MRLACLAATAALLCAPTLAPAAPIAQLILESDPAPWAGSGGFNRIYRADAGDWVDGFVGPVLRGGVPAGAFFNLAGPQIPYVGYSDYSYLAFSTVGLRVPTEPGTYTEAERYSSATRGHPGLDVTFRFSGCNALTGSFTVSEASFIGLAVDTFAVSFEQHCNGGTATLRGSLYYSASGVLPVPEPSTAIIMLGALLALPAVRRWRTKGAGTI